MASNPNIEQSSGRQTPSARHKFNRIFVGQTLAVILCPASNGKPFAATIDREDVDRVMAMGHWRTQNVYGKKGVCLYAVTGSGKNIKYMHRFILGFPAGKVVDHKQHRTLDNRKSELRIISHALNVLDQKPQPSLYGRGVHKHTHGFIGRIRHNGKYTNLGVKKTPEEARETVRQFLLKHGANYAAERSV